MPGGPSSATCRSDALARVGLHQALHLSSVITAAGQGRTHHLEEAKILLAFLAILIELLRGDESVDRQVFRTWGEVLADGDDVDMMLTQVVQHLDHFGIVFT